VLEVDSDARVVGFREKPDTPPAVPWSPGTCLASMGIYIFDMDVLVEALRKDSEAVSTHDFGRDILPRLVGSGERVYTYLFWDENKKEAQYWRDVGTLDAYFEASMDLVEVDPVFNLYDPEWPLRTYQPQLPPAKFVLDEDGRRGMAIDSIVSMGCIVSGGEVRRSILCPGARVRSYSHVESSILLPGAVVGRHARVKRAIVDRGVELPQGARVGYDAAEDRRRHTVSEGGVVVVTPGEECLIES
jgi:glucose-1-phosphate adenylyltransferase